ncbi:AzlD domain-containing protein [Bacillus sp. FSL W7-1360]
MYIFLIIVAMAIVTYLPRFLPVIALGYITLPTWAEKWLLCVPYAALAALIFPGILSVHENPLVGIVAGGVAVICAYFRAPVLIILTSAVVMAFMLS